MDYNRLLETVSLPLFRIRICEEEIKETAKASRLWGCAWTSRAGNTERSFSANAVGVVSTVCSENFNVLIIVFHGFFQMFVFFAPSSMTSNSCLLFWESHVQENQEGDIGERRTKFQNGGRPQ